MRQLKFPELPQTAVHGDSVGDIIIVELARQPLLPQGDRGKSGLHRAGCQVTPGRREPMESATENIPPMRRKARVRVKRCGKSAPRDWQQAWQGKPHPEQDQIGERWCGPHCSRVGCLRCTVTCIPDEWLSMTEPGLSADSFFIFTRTIPDPFLS